MYEMKSAGAPSTVIDRSITRECATEVTAAESVGVKGIDPNFVLMLSVVVAVRHSEIQSRNPDGSNVVCPKLTPATGVGEDSCADTLKQT